VLKRAGSQFANAIPKAEVRTLPGWRNFAGPVGIITITYHEVEIREKIFTAHEVISTAKTRAVAFIKSLVPDVALLQLKIPQSYLKMKEKLLFGLLWKLLRMPELRKPIVRFVLYITMLLRSSTKDCIINLVNDSLGIPRIKQFAGGL